MTSVASSTPKPGLGQPLDSTVWETWAQQILNGQPMSAEQGLAILTAPDDQLLSIMSAAYKIRHQHFSNQVQLYLLMNAKSGLCPEDCHYCSQSKISSADIPKYNLLNEEKLLDGARVAKENQARTYCIVISARGPNRREVEAVCNIVPKIKEKYDLHICACLGLLNDEQAQQLKSAGVDRINHNLNTSGNHYASICSTHTFEDRLDTLKACRSAGLELCSGGILGMGEQPADVVDMAITLRDVGVESLPVNFLNPIEGTPLENNHQLNPRYCLKALAMFRFCNPNTEIRIAGGREMHLRSLQPLGLYAANSIFVGDYLTTQGQPPREDFQMIEDLGFEVITHHEPGKAVATVAEDS